MSRKGLTLVEVIFASVIMTIVVGGLYSVYLSGIKVWDEAGQLAEMQAEARRGMEFMVGELRNATRTSTQAPSPNLSIPAEPNNDQITFYLPDDLDLSGYIIDEDTGQIEWDTANAVVYQLDTGQGAIIRTYQGQQRVILRDVTNLQFEDISIDPTLSLFEMRIILGVTKVTTRGRSLSFTLNSLVRLRN